MYNCYRVFQVQGNRLLAVFGTEIHAEALIGLLLTRGATYAQEDFRIERAFIPDIGF